MMNQTSFAHNFCPGLTTRLLLVMALFWRLAEELQVSAWRENLFGNSQQFFDYPYTVHIVLAPFWSVLLLYITIAVISVIWLRRGGWWGLLLIVADSSIADQNLPIGWGALASHPAILLCVIWDLGSDSVKKHFGWIFLTQITFMYGMSILSKDLRFWLKSPGSALVTLQGDILPTSFGNWISKVTPPGGGVLLDYLILGVQAAALLFWFTRKKPRGRNLIAFALITFHVLSALTLNIRPFALACIAIVAMALPQKEVLVKKIHPWISYLCLSVWVTGIIAATFWLWIPGLQPLGLRQSWRIMLRPVVTKPLSLEVKRNGIHIPVEGREEKILVQGIMVNEKLRNFFVRSLCLRPEDQVGIIILSGSQKIIEASAECRNEVFFRD